MIEAMGGHRSALVRARFRCVRIGSCTGLFCAISSFVFLSRAARIHIHRHTHTRKPIINGNSDGNSSSLDGAGRRIPARVPQRGLEFRAENIVIASAAASRNLDNGKRARPRPPKISMPFLPPIRPSRRAGIRLLSRRARSATRLTLIIYIGA